MKRDSERARERESNSEVSKLRYSTMARFCFDCDEKCLGKFITSSLLLLLAELFDFMMRVPFTAVLYLTMRKLFTNSQ
jgi:hypothetical protein